MQHCVVVPGGCTCNTLYLVHCASTVLHGGVQMEDIFLSETPCERTLPSSTVLSLFHSDLCFLLHWSETQPTESFWMFLTRHEQLNFYTNLLTDSIFRFKCSMQWCWLLIHVTVLTLFSAPRRPAASGETPPKPSYIQYEFQKHINTGAGFLCVLVTPSSV